MNCFVCKYENSCEGADCYYDRLQEQREAQPDYDEVKYYMVNMCDGCARTDKMFSKRGIDEYRRKYPEDDMRIFLTKEDIEADGSIRWGTKEG